MYIETKDYKVKSKDSPFVFIISGLLLNRYFELGLGSQFVSIEEIKED